jgi:flagellar biosynthetic protein FlhB
MAEEVEGQERTEQATPRRQEEARRQGQIARSRDLTTMVLLLAGSGMLLAFGAQMGERLAGVMRGTLSLPVREVLRVGSPATQFMDALGGALFDFAPFFVLTLLVAGLAPLLVGGWNFSAEALEFKWERLSPLAGLKRMFGLVALMEFAKTTAKFTLFSVVTGLVLWLYADDLMRLGSADVRGGLIAGAWIVGKCFLLLCATTAIIAAIDVPWQFFSHARNLRMTREELREELKETEGKPEIKSRIRRLQQEVATRRMMEEVPKADVVVTNPTHYAVALRYDRDRMAAPCVVARGVDEVAMRIIHVAAGNKVVRIEAPPLARALYHSTRLGQQIPAGLYLAVARVLAYVFALRGRPAGAEPPVAPADLPIPENLRRAS